jgi:hypothetical protein
MTIEEAARFDSHGLWLCKTARFSKRGTLKNTVLHFVQTSREGMTHQELVTLLAVRVHDTLLDVVKEGGIRRQRLGPTFVYLSGKRSVEKKQILRRKELLKERRRPRATCRQKIATLLELVQDPKVCREDIVLRCRRAGVMITQELVDTIFEEYELDKKSCHSDLPPAQGGAGEGGKPPGNRRPTLASLHLLLGARGLRKVRRTAARPTHGTTGTGD